MVLNATADLYSSPTSGHTRENLDINWYYLVFLSEGVEKMGRIRDTYEKMRELRNMTPFGWPEKAAELGARYGAEFGANLVDRGVAGAYEETKAAVAGDWDRSKERAARGLDIVMHGKEAESLAPTGGLDPDEALKAYLAGQAGDAGAVPEYVRRTQEDRMNQFEQSQLHREGAVKGDEQYAPLSGQLTEGAGAREGFRRITAPSGGTAWVPEGTQAGQTGQVADGEERIRDMGVVGPGLASGDQLAQLFPKTYAAQQKAAGAKDPRFDDPDMAPYKKEIQKLEKLAGSMHKSGASRRQATARLKEINADVTSRRATREAKELREANVKIAKAQVEMDRAATFDKAQKAWAKGRNLDDASVTKMNREIRNVLRGNDEVEQLFAMAKSADQSDELMSGIHDIVFGEQYDPETLGEFITTFVAGNILK
jgi:hypothetical protein